MADRIRVLAEFPGAGRLGRHVEHDERSRAFSVEPTPPIRSVRWERHIPILDQGDLGSCTGNAATGCLGYSPFFETLPQGTKLDETEAVALYTAATAIDDIPGQYPPDDTGSSGLAVAKAATAAGFISSYQHAFGLDQLLRGLSERPLIIGVNWYASFDAPSQAGELAITADAFVRGGHEICLDENDLDNERAWMANSWGEDWGQDGRAWFSYATLSRLLSEEGDCTAFVALSG